MFSLNENQRLKLKEWINSKKSKYVGAIGGRITYSFTPTTLGTVVKVYDELTKDEIDLTEYEKW